MDEIMTEVTNTEETAVQEPVVEAPSEPETVEQPEEQPAEQPQTRNENIRQAAMRRSRERDLQQQLAQMQEGNSQLMDALKGYGYSGTPAEVADMIRASQKGVTYEDYRAQQEADQARLKEMMAQSPEYREMQDKLHHYEEQSFAHEVERDLESIRKAFPDSKAKTLDDLGTQFVGLRASGIDAVTAYAAIRQAQQATAKPVPPVMGAVDASQPEKDYYTSEELDRLTDKELDDPKTYKKAMSSLLRLGRKK